MGGAMLFPFPMSLRASGTSAAINEQESQHVRLPRGANASRNDIGNIMKNPAICHCEQSSNQPCWLARIVDCHARASLAMMIGDPIKNPGYSSLRGNSRSNQQAKNPHIIMLSVVKYFMILAV